VNLAQILSAVPEIFQVYNHAHSLGMSSTTFTEYAPESTEVSDITQNKGNYAVQGHSRSPILVPIESSCTT